MAAWEKNKKLRFRAKNEKGPKNKVNNFKKEGKGLRNASFWVINSKTFAGGLPIPPAPHKEFQKRGRG